MSTALVIDDTDANRQFFERLLAQAGFLIRSAANGTNALKIADELERLELAIIDMEIPDMSGLEIVARLRKRFPSACLVIATMHDERTLMDSAFARGCDLFMVKPHGFVELFKRLQTQGTEGLHASRPLVIDQYGLRNYGAYSA